MKWPGSTRRTGPSASMFTLPPEDMKPYNSQLPSNYNHRILLVHTIEMKASCWVLDSLPLNKCFSYLRKAMTFLPEVENIILIRIIVEKINQPSSIKAVLPACRPFQQPASHMAYNTGKRWIAQD